MPNQMSIIQRLINTGFGWRYSANNTIINYLKIMKKNMFTFINIKFTNITLAKFISAFITIVIISGVKYAISGGFYLEYSYFFENIAVGLIGWTVNQSLICLFTDWLSLNGINLNLKQILFGFHTVENSDIKVKELKVKRYNAMESGDGSGLDSCLDKGKGVDREQHPFHGSEDSVMESENTPDTDKRLDKGKGVDREQHPFHGSEYNVRPVTDNIAEQLANNLNPATRAVTEPPFALWSKVFPGLDPRSVIYPQRVNPGPGFNVPGGEVPIRDEICKHIDYNSHILKQFKTMDLEVAIVQRNNNLLQIQWLESKLAFAQNALTKVPTIPTTDYEFRLRNKIISDLNDMANKKTRSEARIALLNSRIQFIELNMDKKN